MRSGLRHLLGRVTQVWHKLSWGARIVGPWTTAAGVVRLVALRLTRRRHARVVLTSGLTIGFDVPAQVPPALVVFRTLIDPEYAFLDALADAEGTVAEPRVVLDVGAAIGQFSLFAAQRPRTVVHAFEPSGPNVASLRRNIASNGLTERVSVHQMALSDWEGEQPFTTQSNTYLSRPDAGTPDPGVGGVTELVAVQTLAGVCQELGIDRVAVLKINVAGYEPEVLAGAVPLLASGSVDVLVMLIGARSVQWYERCAAWGYRFFFYEPVPGTLHELADVTLPTLEHPPSPARHVIAIHRDAPALDLLTHRRRDVVAP